MAGKTDVVVLGGGISGLVAAAICAREGLSTLLVERSSQLGGRTRYSREAGYHVPPGPRAFPRDGLERACARAEVEAPVFECGKYRFFDTVTGTERAFLEEPEDAGARRERFHLGAADSEALEQVMASLDPDTWAGKTMAGWMEAMHFPPRLRRLLTASAVWATDAALTPETLSMDRFPMGAVALYIGVVNWTEFCSDPRVNDAFARALAERGAEVRLETAVRRVVIERGAVRGVVLEDLHSGCFDYVAAPRVISSIPFPAVVRERLIDPELLPRPWVEAAAPSESCSGGYVTTWYGLRERVIDNKSSVYLFATDPETGTLTYNPGIIGPFSNRIPDVAPPGKQLIFSLAKIAPHERSDWPALRRKAEETHARTAAYFRARGYPELDKVAELRTTRIALATWGQQSWSIYGNDLPETRVPGIEGLILVGATVKAEPGTFGYHAAILSALRGTDEALGRSD